jgi:hypothetical protein
LVRMYRRANMDVVLERKSPNGGVSFCFPI